MITPYPEQVDWEVEMEMMEVMRVAEGTQRTLIIQNIFRGDIGSTEPCQRQHRQCGIMLELL
jgi:hypothetical protein